MTLYNIIMAMPMDNVVTVADYITHDILVDCESVHNILGSRRFVQELSHLHVYQLEVGKVHGDLIVCVCEN